MKTAIVVSALFGALFSGAGLCAAGSGSWTADASGYWHDPVNWRGGAVADGAGYAAAFTNGMTGWREITIDGAAAPSPTLGTLLFGAITNGFNIRANNGGRLLFDNSGAPALIAALPGAPGVTVSAPLLIAQDSRLILSEGYAGDRQVDLSGKISGTNVVIENAGTQGAAVFRIGNAANDFTGEVWASGAGRLNVAAQDIEEAALGAPTNIVRLFPGSRFTPARYGHALFNPLRTFVLEGGGPGAFAEMDNRGESNEKKHVSAPITGAGSLAIYGNYILSAANDFTGMLDLQQGNLWISSDANLGKGPLRISGNGVNFGVIGREFKDFGEREVEFTIGNNGGTYIAVLDPGNVFTLDRSLSLTLNSGGAASLGKSGPGELRIAAPQNISNASGRSIAANGGPIRYDYGMGAAVHGAAQNHVGFQGGTIILDAAGATNAIVQAMGNFRLDGDGGRLIADQGGTAFPFALNMGNFTSMAHQPGGALIIETRGEPSLITLTSTDANAADTGIIGGGRVVLNEDWPSSPQSGAALAAYAAYSALPPAGADPAANALLTASGAVSASEAVNTLKIAPSADGQSLDIDGGATLTLRDGALLFAGEHDFSINGGALKSGRGGDSDFFLHHVGSGVLTLNAPVVSGSGRSAFTKTGPGKAALLGGAFGSGPLTIAEGVLEIRNPDFLVAAAGELSGFTCTKAGNIAACSMQELPESLVTGAYFPNLGCAVQSISGAPGAWDITLSGTPWNAVDDGSIGYTVSRTIRNNGVLRIAESAVIGHATVQGGSGAGYDIADGKTVVISGGRSGGVMALDNTDPVGDGVLRVNNTVELGSALHIRRGVYEAAAGSGLGATGATPLVFGGGEPATFRAYGNNKKVVVAELSGANPAAVVENGVAGAALFAVANGADNLFAGTIRDGAAGTLRFLKSGSGRLALSGANTYSGGTAVNGGVLEISGSVAGSATVNRGSIAGSGALGGDLVVNGGATLLPLEPAPFVGGDISLNGALAVDGIESLPPGEYPLFACGGSLSANAVSIANEPVGGKLRYTIFTTPDTAFLRVHPQSTQLIVR